MAALPKIYPGDTCPACTRGGIMDPEASDNGGLPPTGGDHEYIESRFVPTCDTCGEEFETSVKRRYWLDEGRLEYHSIW